MSWRTLVQREYDPVDTAEQGSTIAGPRSPGWKNTGNAARTTLSRFTFAGGDHLPCRHYNGRHLPGTARRALRNCIHVLLAETRTNTKGKRATIWRIGVARRLTDNELLTLLAHHMMTAGEKRAGR